MRADLNRVEFNRLSILWGDWTSERLCLMLPNRVKRSNSYSGNIMKATLSLETLLYASNLLCFLDICQEKIQPAWWGYR